MLKLVAGEEASAWIMLIHSLITLPKKAPAAVAYMSPVRVLPTARRVLIAVKNSIVGRSFVDGSGVVNVLMIIAARPLNFAGISPIAV